VSQRPFPGWLPPIRSILITHKLNEALTISDRITILKLGKKDAELSGDELRQMGYEAASDKILKAMFGDMPIPECTVVDKDICDEIVLEMDKVEATNLRGIIGLEKVSLKIKKGEIFGIAGVDGNG